MADYKGIKGFKVQSLASDPTVNEGQIWYNTTSDTLKYDTIAAGAWSSGGTINTARNHCGGAGTTVSAALVMGGHLMTFSNPYSSATTESYDGTSWTEVTAMTVERSYFTGVGPQTAALVGLAHGVSPPGGTITNTETYNGTGWTEVADANTARANCGEAGTTTACLFSGGGPSAVGLTEDYNGTSWTVVNELNTARWKMGPASTGSPSATMVFAGENPATSPFASNLVEEWNGTSWTAITALGTVRFDGGGSGTVTAALCISGNPNVVNCESWNGTAWTEVANVAYPRYAAGYGGNSSTSQAIYMAGEGPGSTDNWTEEWDGAPVSAQTVTTS